MKQPGADLQAKWYARLREDGFRDIEAPSGIIQRRTVTGATEANSAREEEYFARAQEFLASHRFANQLERLIWQQHAARKGRREAAKELGLYPRKVDEVVHRLQAIMLRPKRGAPRGHRPGSLRGEGRLLTVRVDEAHMVAIDRIRTMLGTRSRAEAIRYALTRAPHRINGGTGK